MPQNHTYDISQGHSVDFGIDNQDANQIVWPDKPFVPLAERKRPAPRPVAGTLATIAEVEASWHAQLRSKAVEQAAGELHEALAVAEDARAGLASIPAEIRAEEAAVIAAAKADAAGGEPLAKIERQDWTAEEAYRAERWKVAHNDAAKAANRYRAVAASEARKAVPALIERAAKARQAARPALAKAEKAIAEAQAATSAIFAANESLGLTPSTWHQWPAEERQIGEDVSIGVRHLLRWIDAAEDSALLSGRFVLDTSDKVPEHTLRALAEGNEFDQTYVLPNILHAQDRADEIRDATFTPDPDFREVHLKTKRLPR